MAIPGCSVNGKVFVGQRKEAFASLFLAT